MPRDYKKNCPCPSHPFGCFGHPTNCECAKPVLEPGMSPDYAEILRLHRKYKENDGDPLWKVFVSMGQRLEKLKPDRCPSCLYTYLGYRRLVSQACSDPFHTVDEPDWHRELIDREPDHGQYAKSRRSNKRNP